MRVLLINLERSPDRLAAMSARLDAVRQPFELLRATDGRTLGPEAASLVDNARRRLFADHHLSRNEIACALSHLRALRSLLDSGDRMLAVLEDDVEVDPDLPRVLSAIERAGPRFDQVNLHRTPGRREFFSPSAPLLPGWQVGRVGWSQIGAQGYVVSAAGAARILAGCQKLVLSQDNWTQRVWANGLDLYGLNRPAVAPLASVPSTISESRLLREPMPGASSPASRAARRLVRIGDSLAKRLHYPYLVWKGRRRWAAGPEGPG